MKFECGNRLTERRRDLLICLLLAAVTTVAYWRLGSFDFTDYDEFFMVVNNPIVSAGLTVHGAWWALTTSWFEYWHPLTWLSHMLDCQLFGLRAGWHHIVSLLFHVANTALVFVLFRRMTGAVWRSALVAGVFALHPLHVESVAWVAERKDVLSTLFFLLTAWAYVQYVEQAKSQGPRGKTWYRLSLVSFGLALMCKPMVVTLPFVLLLLDYWPLHRFELTSASLRLDDIARLMREKLPFFGLSLAGCVITYSGVKAGGNLLPSDMVPWGLRLANVPISYVRYLGKMLWPTDLVVLYPLPSHWPSWQILGSVLVLLGISGFVLTHARSAPYLAVGWFIFLGVLVPTIGIVQVGFQSIADRYTYIPFIGLFVAVVWGVAELSLRWRSGMVLLSALAALVLACCGAVTWRQVGYWRDGLTVWTHCLAAAPETAIARYNLGLALQLTGRVNEAIAQYNQVLRLKPDHRDANLNLGTAFIFQGRMADATNCFAKVLQLKPDYAKAHANMGLALRELSDFSGAMVHCAEAIRLDPSQFGPYVDMARSLSAVERSQEAVYYFDQAIRLNPAVPQTHYYFGLELLKLGRLDEALASLSQAVRLAPNWSDAHFQLAGAMTAKGETAQAIAEYRRALKLQADSTAALNNLAWLLATCPDITLRNGAEAVSLAQEACERTSWKQTVFVGTLAAAYAEAGDFNKAVETSEKACDLASSLGETNLLQPNQELLRQFKNHQPYRQSDSLPQSRL